MSNCSNCYNGCTEIVSDRCVKYTGIDVPVLGIQTGDSLSFVEQALITFLTSTLDGTGIKINLGDTVVCTLVQQYLPTCGDLTIVDISKALIQAACDLQEQVDAIDADLATLNANYTIECLTGVTSSSDTHAIVQAVINKLCQVQVDLTALALDLSTNYSSNGAELNAYIANYLATNAPNSNLISSKMVPYSILPYFGPLSNFDGTGAGTGNWLKIYLCNGANPGVPDLRGRTLVGATSMLGSPITDPVTNPAISGNPSYTLSGSTPPFIPSVAGINRVTLDVTEIPSHTHIATAVSTITPATHSHFTVANSSSSTLNSGEPINATNSTGGNLGYSLQSSSAAIANVGKTDDVTISATTAVSNDPIGGGIGHANIQPSIASYFIIYIP
jgi:microcystin-dependent protein